MKQQMLAECLEFINMQPFGTSKVMIVKYREMLAGTTEEVKSYRDSLLPSTKSIVLTPSKNAGFNGSSTSLHGDNIESKLTYDEKVRGKFHNNHLNRDFY